MYSRRDLDQYLCLFAVVIACMVHSISSTSLTVLLRCSPVITFAGGGRAEHRRHEDNHQAQLLEPGPDHGS